MQSRPYAEKNGNRLWLSRPERRELLEAVTKPRRRIAIMLAMHGLRSDEVVDVEPRHVLGLAGDATGAKVVVADGKTGRREAPISPDLRERVRYLVDADRQQSVRAPIVDVATRTIRSWVQGAREELADGPDDDWHDLGLHDLRRTWATDTYYSLATAGVPIAETLVLAWGGWAQTETGRDTLRQNYLGPVPDHVTERATASLELPTAPN